MQADDKMPAPKESAETSLFDWDSGNIAHIAEHDVAPEEAEEVLLGDPLDTGFHLEEGDEERWSYLGETNRGRILRVVITLRGEKIRVVTAFEPLRQYKRLYLETKAGR
jgi:uncharacterized DUF497 family protein